MNKKSLAIVAGSVVGSFLLAAVIVLGSLYVVRHSGADNMPQVPGRNADDAKADAKKVVTSNIVNLRFEIPAGWTKQDPTTFEMPAPFGSPYAVLRKDGSTCVIAHVQTSQETFMAQKQVSFDDRVHSKHFQFDGSWYVLKNPQTEQLVFSGKARQYLPGERRISGYFGQSFVLFTSDGASVPDDCNTDLNTLLATVENYFEKSPPLTAKSEGTLVVGNVFNDELDTNDDVIHVLFIPANSQEKLELLVLPQGSMIWNPLYVSKNRVYFPINEYGYTSERITGFQGSSLAYFDPFERVARKVPNTTETGYISSIYLKNDYIAYVALSPESTGSNCVDKPDDGCEGTLYEIKTDGTAKRTLATDIRGVTIRGYDHEASSTYLTYGYADAGFCTGTVTEVKDGMETVYPSDDCITGKFREIIDRFEPAFTRTESIRVSNGTLSPQNRAGEPEHQFFYFER